jgi:acetyl esterase/lipase
MTFATMMGFFGSLLLPLPVQAEDMAKQTFEVESIKDIAYYQGDGAHPVKHKLDLFIPRGQKDFPVLFFVHGGAWRNGDKNFLGFYSALGQFFAQQGIGTVVINYRLSPAVQHPEHIKDVARAFAWTCKNVGRYGGRTDQIFVSGHSAGGHLVSLLATDESYLKAEGLTTKQVRGVVAISGVYILPQSGFVSVFGEDAEARKKASPIQHVRAGLPPFLILYADKDYPGCDKAPSEAFARALKDKGNEARTVEVVESNHFQIIASAALANHTVSQAILTFITTHASNP